MSAFQKEKVHAVSLAGDEPAVKTPYRRHSAEFKLHVCSEIRSGRLGRRDAQKKYRLSDNLLQHWLAKFDLQSLQREAVKPSPLDACQAHISALERKIGQLTMALDGLSCPDRLDGPEITRGDEYPPARKAP